MVNKKQIALNGSFGLVGIIMLVIGIIQFAKGSSGLIGGIGSIAVIAVLFMAFMAARQNPKVEAWLKSGEVTKASPSASDIERRFQEMQQKVREVKSDEAEAAKHEGSIMAWTKRVVAHLSPITSRLSRKPTIGEQLTEMARARPEAMKSIEMLAVEVATSQRFILKTIAGLESEHAAVAEKVKETKRRRAELSKLEKKVASDISKYEKVAAGTDLEAKIREFRDIEARLDKTKADSNIDFKQVVDEISKAESDCNYLQNLGKRIADTVKELQDSIRPDWRDKTYQDMMARLDRMDRALKENLVRAASEHKELLGKVSEKVRVLEDNIRKVKQSELFEMMLSHRTKAATAAAEADVARRRIAELGGQLDASQKRGVALDARVKALEGQVKDFEKVLATWQSDLESARELVKKNPQMGSKLVEVLGKNIREQSSLLFTLISIVRAKEDFAASCKTDAETVGRQLLEARTQVAQIEARNAALAESLETANAAKECIQANIESLREEVKKEKEELAKSVEEKVRQEHHDRIIALTADLERATADLKKVSEEKEKIQQELKGRGDELAAAKGELEELRPQLPLLEERERAAREEAERVTRQMAEVERNKNENVVALEKRIAELERAAAEAARGTEEASRQTVRVSSEADELKKDLKRISEEREAALRKASSAGEREAAEKEAKERFERISRELAETNEKLVMDVKTWHDKAMERLKLLTELTRSSTAMRRELEDSVAAKKRSNENAKKRMDELTRELEDIKSLLKRMESAPKEEFTEEDKSIMARLRDETATTERQLETEREVLRKTSRELTETRNELEMRIAELSGLTDRVNAADRQVRQAEAEQKRLADQIAQDMHEHKAEVDALEGKVEEKKRDVSRLEGELIVAQQGLEEAAGDADRLTKEKAEEERLKLEKVKENEELARNLSLATTAAAAAEELDRELGRLRDAHVELKAAFDEYKREKESELESARIAEGALRNDNTTLQGERDSLATQLAGAKADLELIRAQATSVPGLEEEVQRARAEVERLAQELRVTSATLENRKDELKAAVERIRRLENELEGLPQRIAEERTDAALVDKDVARQKRKIWFNGMTRTIREDLEKAEKNRDEAAVDMLDEQLDYIKKFKTRQKLTQEELQTLEMFRIQLEGLKQRVLAELKKDREVTQPNIVLAKPKVIAIGDVHGDVERLKNVLVKAGVIDGQLNWTAPEGVKVVMLGDYIDRGPATFEVLNLVYTLKQKAGNSLVMLIGNHEMMFLGAFDWEGFDDSWSGRRAMKKYKTGNAKFKALMGEGVKQTDELVDATLNRMDPNFRKAYLRINRLTLSWWQNDRKADSVTSSVCEQLGLDSVEVINNPSKLVNAKYKGTPVRSYIDFLRNNLVTHHHVKDDNVLFVHAGIPYEVTNVESINMKQHRQFQGFFAGAALNSILSDIGSAVRKRSIELWMAFSERSPVFACHPGNRDLEWNKLSVFKESMVHDSFGFNAVVFGHSYHVPDEDKLSQEYKDKPRRVYNIDFGMSIHYNKSHGGWLVLNDNSTIDINVIEKSGSIKKYTYSFKEAPKTAQAGAGVKK